MSSEHYTSVPLEESANVVRILKSIILFRNLTNNECGKLVPLLKEIGCAAGDVVIEQGETGNAMYVIKQGEVEVWRHDEHDGRVSLGSLPEGSFFGELSLFDNLPRSASVQCAAPVQLYRLDRSDFEQLLKQDIFIANKVYSNCLTETFKRFRNIVSNFTFSQYNLREKTEALEEIGRDLEHARRMQRYFIDTEFLDRPDALPTGITQRYIYRPCIEIGGDFINVQVIDGRYIAIIIADVAGHGISAAMATGVIKSGLSLFSAECATAPARMLDRLNQHFFELMDGHFATCAYALVDTVERTITVSRAGHPYPAFWIQSERRSVEAEMRGVALGIVREYSFSEQTFGYAPGDKLFLYTDGIIEQTGLSGTMYGAERLFSTFALAVAENRPVLDALFGDLFMWSGRSTFTDDITMFLLEFND